jgi:hypothetical protein
MWEASKTKFIYIANISHVSTSDMTTNELEPNFLHLAQNKWLWTFLQASTAIRQRTRDEGAADIIFVRPAPSISPHLSSLWRECTSVYGNRSPKKCLTVLQVFSTPLQFSVTPVIDSASESKDIIDQWGVPI